MRLTPGRQIAPRTNRPLHRFVGAIAAGALAGIVAGCHSPQLKGDRIAKADPAEKPIEGKYVWSRIRGVGKPADRTATAQKVAPVDQGVQQASHRVQPAPKSAVVPAATPKPSEQTTPQPPARIDAAKPPANSTAPASPPVAVASESPAPPGAIVEAAPIAAGRAAVLMRPYGAAPDQPGIADNISGRVGMTYYDVGKENAVGVSMMLESSAQLGSSDRFVHAGIGAEYLDEEWPISSHVGFSKLATIEGDQVTKPGIFSIAYDSYFDSSYFGTLDNIYIDQIRLLAGWAISPRTDVGMWAAIGINGDGGTITTPAGVGFIPARFGDRVAGYVSTNVGQSGSLWIASAGWEGGPGRIFAESDLFVPLTDSLNLFGGFGYSDNKSFDAIVGIEIMPSKWALRRGKRIRGDACSVVDPCAIGDAVCSSTVDPACCGVASACGPTYRGGWANGNYRGALRLISPSRMRRMIEDPNLHLAAAGVAGPRPIPGVVLPPDEPPTTPEEPQKPNPSDPGVGGNEPPQKPPVVTPPDICPPAPATPDVCVPRILTRPKRTSTLSQSLAGSH